MAMLLSSSKNGLLSRLRGVANLQYQAQIFNHALAEGDFQAHLCPELVPDSVAPRVQIDMSKWKKIDSRLCGIQRSMISDASLTVLKILRGEGYQVYLVGGCVRDLVLKKAPKDYDVITTATLEKIQKTFHFCRIVGKRFPICRVHIKGSVVEVSSFETVAPHDEEKEKPLLSQMPSRCSEKDFICWRNSMQRDFTINSLFFDPFVNKIYDYANGLTDLKALKLRTLIPAQLSFTEDCARILRALRIAARLGLSFSRETEIAMYKLSSSIMSLDKFRMMLELNSMLSYGAALQSLCLLQRFKLLKILLPFQAAYLDEQASKKCAQTSTMLMKLFSNLDKLVTPDKPSDCILWVGLLAFHLALVNNPQDARVVRAFASVLYHANWKEGVKSAVEHAQAQMNFVPEISGFYDFESEELAERVTKFASLVQCSIATLCDEDSLLEAMSRYPGFPSSGLVFVPKKAWYDVYDMFQVLVSDIESYEIGRECFDINYFLLGKGNLLETRFVLGKVILETMTEGIVRPRTEAIAEKEDHLQMHKFDKKQKPVVMEEDRVLSLSGLVKQAVKINKDGKRRLSASNPAPEKTSVKKQKQYRDQETPEVFEMNECKKHLEVNGKPGDSQDELTRNTNNKDVTKQEEVEKKRNLSSLHSLFK